MTSWSILTRSADTFAHAIQSRAKLLQGCATATLALSIIVGASTAMSQQSDTRRADAGSSDDPREIVLFPFDDYSIPFSYGLDYNLIQGHREGVVLRPSKTGPDAQSVINHGSVLKVGDQLRMWYPCLGDKDPSIDPSTKLPVGEGLRASVRGEAHFRVCYATSTDGINWKKPALGLTKYGANKHNNLVDFPLGERVINLIVIEDAEDPDPSRRFKMAFQSPKYGSRIGLATSHDGLHWKEFSANPVTKWMVEIHGLTKFNGAYYVNGHGGSPRRGPTTLLPRRMVTYMSYDFEHWVDASALSFDRFPGSELPTPFTRGHAGEQIHTGASIWNRGNVLIGFYGQWHGDLGDDRRFVTMDLGMVTSHDAIHFKEPIPDFKIIPFNEEAEIRTNLIFDRLGGAGGGSMFGAALTQGQGWMNMGDHTLYWYSVWSQGRVRLATWERDRLGYFAVPREIRERQGNPAARRGLQEGKDGLLHLPPRAKDLESPWAKVSPHFISMPITLDGSEQKVFVNAGGLSADTYIKVEILDEKFNILPGYSKEDCAPIMESGFRQAAVWGGKTTIANPNGPIRVRVSIEGKMPEDVRIYATYVATK